MENVRGDDQHDDHLMCLKSVNKPTLLSWSGEGNLLKMKDKQTELMTEIQGVFETLCVLYI